MHANLGRSDIIFKVMTKGVSSKHLEEKKKPEKNKTGNIKKGGLQRQTDLGKETKGQMMRRWRKADEVIEACREEW